MTEKTRHSVLIDILKMAKEMGYTNCMLAVLIQTYIADVGFLDDEGARQVRELLSAGEVG